MSDEQIEKVRERVPKKTRVAAQGLSVSFHIGLHQGRGRRLVKFSYQNHPTKVDVTSGQIGAQQPVSAKSNDGVPVRLHFFGFLSHQYQEM